MANDVVKPPPNPLGHHEERIWPENPGAYGGRRARKGGPYEVFLPDPIAERDFELSGEAVATISEATKALAGLEGTSPKYASLDAFAGSLLRSESAASSRIEGLQISQRRLARAAFSEEGGRRGDNRAAEVLGNVRAMQSAIKLGRTRRKFSVTEIKEIHRTLLRFTADRAIAGMVRTKQNWIEGNDFNPIGASYVPPPPEAVPGLLRDLCRFVERDDLAPLAQAAIAHAQFENIHPFADGNGRVGRALIYVVLLRRGEAMNYVPPISLVLAAQPKNYIDGFGSFSAGDVSAWCTTFADAAGRAAGEAERMATLIEDRQEKWLETLGRPRSDAAVRAVVAALPGQPVIDVASGQKLTKKSHVAIQNALKQLEEARILQRLNERKWGRVWECGDLLELLESFEETVS